MDIDGRGTETGWQSVTASSRAVGALVDTAIVEGVQGQVGGVIEFLWDVTGTSNLSLDPKLASDAYIIEEFRSLAILSPSEGDGLLNEVFENNPPIPLFGTSVQSSVPAFASQQVFFVDWIVGEEFDVFFQLATVARLKVTNFDAAGFEANLDVDFGNTASLSRIRILDDQGNVIPDATLTSNDPSGPVYADVITAVPEPSGFLFVLMLFTLAGTPRYARKFSFVGDAKLGVSQSRRSV